MSLSNGRVVVRTRFSLRCADCGTEYRPRVHAYPGLVIALGLLAILGMVVAFVLWHTGQVDRSWVLWAKVAAALIVAVIGYMASRLHKRLMEPSFYTWASGREPEYGEIVLECPRCGSAAASLAG